MVVQGVEEKTDKRSIDIKDLSNPSVPHTTCWPTTSLSGVILQYVLEYLLSQTRTIY